MYYTQCIWIAVIVVTISYNNVQLSYACAR